MAKRKLLTGMLLVILMFPVGLPALNFNNIAVIQEQSKELTGVWSWVIDHGYLYIFNADGTGRRGFPGMMEEFIWSTSGNELRINHELWTFIIMGNIITIFSRQEEGLVFSYMRR